MGEPRKRARIHQTHQGQEQKLFFKNTVSLVCSLLLIKTSTRFLSLPSHHQSSRWECDVYAEGDHDVLRAAGTVSSL
jgi:hypothetical protein